jgi:hypothetical protein
MRGALTQSYPRMRMMVMDHTHVTTCGKQEWMGKLYVCAVCTDRDASNTDHVEIVGVALQASTGCPLCSC